MGSQRKSFQTWTFAQKLRGCNIKNKCFLSPPADTKQHRQKKDRGTALFYSNRQCNKLHRHVIHPSWIARQVQLFTAVKNCVGSHSLALFLI